MWVFRGLDWHSRISTPLTSPLTLASPGLPSTRIPLSVFCAIRLSEIFNCLLELECTPSPSHCMTSQSSIKSSRTSHAKTPKELDLCIRLRRSRAEESGHNFNPAPSKLQSISSTRAPLRHSTSVSAPVNAPLNFKQTCRNVNVVFSPVTTRPGTCKTGGRREPADASRSILEATTSLWFCVISPRGSCSACFPAFWASTINFVMGKSGGGGVFLAATICRDALEEPLLLFFLALALGFFAAAFMAPSSVETTFSAFFDAALSCSEFILLTVARILFDPLSSFIIIQCSCRIPHFSRSMMLEHIETRWNSSSTPRFEPRRMPPKIHKEAIKQNHGIYNTSLEIPHDSTAYLLASAAYFPVQICPKFEYVWIFLGSISNGSPPPKACHTKQWLLVLCQFTNQDPGNGMNMDLSSLPNGSTRGSDDHPILCSWWSHVDHWCHAAVWVKPNILIFIHIYVYILVPSLPLLYKNCYE